MRFLGKWSDNRHQNKRYKKEKKFTRYYREWKKTRTDHCGITHTCQTPDCDLPPEWKSYGMIAENAAVVRFDQNFYGILKFDLDTVLPHTFPTLEDLFACLYNSPLFIKRNSKIVSMILPYYDMQDPDEQPMILMAALGQIPPRLPKTFKE